MLSTVNDLEGIYPKLGKVNSCYIGLFWLNYSFTHRLRVSILNIATNQHHEHRGLPTDLIPLPNMRKPMSRSHEHYLCIKGHSLTDCCDEGS
jgi:hypothetical protein